MANTSNLKASEQVIKSNIRPNGVHNITAAVMQSVLLNITEAAESDIAAAAVSAETSLENFVNGNDNYGNRSITGDKIADETITSVNIAPQAITVDELSSGSVTTVKIADGNVTHDKIADQSVWTNNIATGAITADKPADGVIGTDTIVDKSVTDMKLATSAVTTDKIYDRDVTRIKLAQDIEDYLLTYEMKEYLNGQLSDQLKEEAQRKFNGTTTSGSTTSFYYDTTEPDDAKKTVSVTLRFEGNVVTADSTPAGWTLDGTTYKCNLSLKTAPSQIAATTFKYTVSGGKYDGIQVTYTSLKSSVQWLYPIWYGFLPGNSPTEELINRSSVSDMTENTTGVNLPNMTLNNPLSSEAYFCILTKGTATATQLGMNILTSVTTAPNFISPSSDRITIENYRVYFTKNSVSAHGSLGNVNLNITQQ